MNAICCPEHDTLEAYLLGDIEDDALDAHLDECAGCQAALDDLDNSVNRPFAGLREPAAALSDWEQPAYQHLVAHAKNIVLSPADRDAVQQPLPYQLGNYLLLELVAVSGMGRVYKAQHLHLKKTVAVKLVAAWLAPAPAGRQRFRQEMEAVGRLASPHIVTAFDAGAVDGVDFLAMEYIDGSDLHRLVSKGGVLPIPQAIDFMVQAARGLAVAHDAGIIHRDVKPSNLILDANGTVKVLDLGLARMYCNDDSAPSADAPKDFPYSEAAKASSLAILGTPAYLAPEQAVDLNKADARTDIYALGCTLHYLLTGRPPYSMQAGPQLIAAHRDAPIPSLREARSDCPHALNTLFRRMLAKNPDDRPTSMNQVIAELERMRFPRRPFAWRGLIAASVVFAASALLAFAFWSAGQGEPKKDEQKVAKTGLVPKKGVLPMIDMARIEPGEFWMGASDTDRNAQASEKPRRKIKINQAFFLGKTEITQAEYQEVMGNNPSAFSAKGRLKARVKELDTSKHPVESVSWLDAVLFANKLSERHELEPYYKIAGEVVTINGGAGYRLPTEAEWEYACRADAKTSWSFGEKADDLKDHAWISGNSGDRTHPVGQKKANQWGLHDMYGNVPEWCWDRFNPDYYQTMPTSDPPGSGTGRERVFRGDAWNSLLPRTSARPALGFTYGGAGSINVVGLRLARNAE